MAWSILDLWVLGLGPLRIWYLDLEGSTILWRLGLYVHLLDCYLKLFGCQRPPPENWRPALGP